MPKKKKSKTSKTSSKKIKSVKKVPEKKGSSKKKKNSQDKIKKKIKLLSKVSIFSSLTQPELEVIAQYSQYASFSNGETIFEEGSIADEVNIIKNGQVLITKTTDDGDTMDVAQFVKGESFGELDLLDDLPRSASARAVDETTVLIFPAREYDFQELLSRHPDLFAHILYKLLIMIAGRLRNVNRLVSEKSPWLQELRLQLYRDKLTGLFNRAFLEEEYGQLLPGYGENSCLIMLKPDNFKDINDKYGHEAGDKALMFLADKISTMLRESDIVIRYRGNEMAAIMPDTVTETAFTIAEAIRTEINRENIESITNGDDFFITMSIGISAYLHDSVIDTELVAMTYKKLYSARESGGDRIVCTM